MAEHDPNEPDRDQTGNGGKLEPIGTSADDADIADEHTKTTFADELPGGPERQPEAESPEGLAGAD